MELIVSVSEMRDESVLRFYDNVRAHVEAERGNQHKFMTRDALKEYVESLRAEMLRRRLQFTPIDFGTNQPPVSRVEKSETSELSLVVESVAFAIAPSLNCELGLQLEDLKSHHLFGAKRPHSEVATPIQ
jgi:hypothetical protein